MRAIRPLVGIATRALITTPPVTLAPPSRPEDRRLETPRAAGVAGLAFAALFVTSLVLLRDQPSRDSTAAEIRNFYLREHGGTVALVGVYLVPFAGIAFLWFIAVVRSLIGEREDRFFATVFLASGLLFVAMLFIAAGVGGALLTAVKARHDPVPSAETVVTVRGLAFGFLFIYAIRMAAVFMIVVSAIGMRLGVLPRWLVVAGYAAALVLIVNVSYLETLVLVFPAWVAAVSIVILKAGRSADRVDAVRSDPRRAFGGWLSTERNAARRRRRAAPASASQLQPRSGGFMPFGR